MRLAQVSIHARFALEDEAPTTRLVEKVGVEIEVLEITSPTGIQLFLTLFKAQ
jgi:uncharacterized membrane protein